MNATGLVLLVAVLVTGCATPDAVRRLEEESVASVQAYAANMRTATTDLLAGYRAAELGRIHLLAELDLADATRMLEVPVLPEPNEDGLLDPAAVSLRAVAYLEPADVLELLGGYQAAYDKLHATVEEYRVALTAAEEDLEDALTLRARIREWLARGGIEAEEIDALAEGLARALKEG